MVVDPKNVLARYNLGVISQKPHQTAAALPECAAALASDPQYVSALDNSATVFAKTNPHLAVSTSQQVLTLAPQNAAARLDLGLLELQLGILDAARAHVAAAVALDKTLLPRVSAALFLKGTLLASTTPAPPELPVLAPACRPVHRSRPGRRSGSPAWK